MATETTNYKMTKDAPNEHYNIDRVNANLDKIDTAIKAVDTDKVSKVAGKNLSTNDYTTPEKDKLAGIEANAKNYSHPSKHPASIITQDASNRFTTDVEKAKWNKTTTDLSALDTTVSQHLADYDSHVADYTQFKEVTETTIGTTALQTYDKTLRGAINEVFQSGNNIKVAMVDKLLSVDPSLPISYNSTWAEIESAAGQISTGKKSFSGSSSNVSGLNVTGLDFAPKSVIIFMRDDSYGYIGVSAFSSDPSLDLTTFPNYTMFANLTALVNNNNTTGAATNTTYKKTFTSNGFTFNYVRIMQSVKWIAFE